MTCALSGCSLPVHMDAVTGVCHDFCGRTHAQLGMVQRGRDLAAPHGPCHECRFPGCRYPVYFDAATGRVHEFCGATHAREAMARGLHPTSLRGARRSSMSEEDEGVCCLPGCVSPRYRERGVVHDYCGRTHARLALRRGLLPPSLAGSDAAGSSDIEKIWRGRPQDPHYTLSVLCRSHPKVQGIKQQFLRSWLHPGVAPTVVRVLQVRNSSEIYHCYEEYRRDRGEERRRWHGTSLSSRCSFGIDPEQPPCSYADCAVCSICARSFDINRAGSSSAGGQRMRLRYGNGLYFSKCSSKSNDYAANSERVYKGERFRVMFLSKVALGRAYETTADLIDDLQPILQDYDTIIGLTTKDGGQLNYQETVVYDDTAAIPSYLVVYRLP